MNIFFTFENAMPSTEADAEVFMSTAGRLASLATVSWLHIPGSKNEARLATGASSMICVVRAYAPRRPALLRHLCCGLSMVFRKEFYRADLVYTRNLWVAWLALLFRQNVVFDHYRPWPAQIPPLRPWLKRLVCNPRFLVKICHSEYTKKRYLELGMPEAKLSCIRNGFDPQRLQPRLSIQSAKRKVGVDEARRTIVYTGRVNHRKGLELVVEAARSLPELQFIFVGSNGSSQIEALAKATPNILLISWQPAERLGDYIYAADVLLIPPSSKPLAEFGTTVLPLKLFLYLASGRPILAGATPDVRELLTHGKNAFLCQPDCVGSLISGLRTLTSDARLAERIASQALADSRDLTWDNRANKIIGVINERLQSPCVTCDPWSGAQVRTWLRQSVRWLIHLARTRSWVLPPDARRSNVDLPPSKRR